MQYRNLGRTGLKVSEICLGSMTFGLYTDETEADRMLGLSIDAGVNFVDTANAYIGGKSGVPKDIPPYVIAAGDRAKLYGLNRVGLKRHGFPETTVNALKKVYRIFFRIGITLNEAIERAQAEVDHLPEVINLINFIKSSQRGITR